MTISVEKQGQGFDVLDYLACFSCHSRFSRLQDTDDLVCPACGQQLAYRNGIYYTGMPPSSEECRRTIEEFGKRWNMVYRQMGGLKSYLMPMIEPVQREFFKGKVVIDSGCGFGRLSKLLLDYGARHVIMLDASDAVIAATDYLCEYRDRITIVQANLLAPPLAYGKSDVFFCHGVLHHTGNPWQVISTMTKALKPTSGAMILWVYAAEGNSAMSSLINMCRLISFRLGERGTWAMAKLVDVVLWLISTVIIKPLIQVGVPPSKLWYGDYLVGFLYNPTINNATDRLQMFHDFLTTRIIEYYSKPQLEKWCRDASFKKTVFCFFRRQSWGVSASFNPTETFGG